MTSFFSFLAKKKFPNKEASAMLWVGPLTVSKTIMYGLFLAFIFLTYLTLIKLNETILITVPDRGGMLTEGIIGAPRFINPILAATDTDQALSHLIFSGLMKESGDGSVTPELAESYEVSPDGHIYTFILRDNIRFHDSSMLTSSDVAFTVEKLRNSTLNPRTAQIWQNVTISTPDQRTIIATLATPNTDFLKMMSVGILSAAQWSGVIDEAFIDPSLNLFPIGTGPFRLIGITEDASGAPKKINFIRNNHYLFEQPLLSKLNIVIFANQEALINAINNSSIDFSLMIDPKALGERPLSKNVAIDPIRTKTTITAYYSSHESLLQNPSVVAVLNRYIDKKKIIATVENGYGIPEGHTETPASLEETITALGKLGYAFKDGVLTKSGIPVTFAIATENNPALIDTSRALASQFEMLGITAPVRAFDQGTFQDGINHAIYPTIVVPNDAVEKSSMYSLGIPLYTKTTLLAAKDNVHGISHDTLSSPALRYSTVSGWYTKTDRIWKWLSKEN